MSNYNSRLQSNNINLEDILNTINALPEASTGVELPELTNEGDSSKLLEGYELISSRGAKVTGNVPVNGDVSETFDGINVKNVIIPAGYTTGGIVSLDNTIDAEVDVQADLISQIMTAVDELPEAGGSDPVLQDKTVTPTTSAQSITADNGYDGLDTVTVNAMPTATQATPSISVSSSGLITASSTQSAGYVSSGTKSATKQLTTQAAKTITPSTSSQTAVASGVYTTGTVTVDAIPDEYMVGNEIATQDNLIEQITTALAGKAAGGTGGGSSMETCTLNMGYVGSSANKTSSAYFYEQHTASGTSPEIHMLTNYGIVTGLTTVCGSCCGLILQTINGNPVTGATVTCQLEGGAAGGAELIGEHNGTYIFKITAAAGEKVYIALT